LNSTPKPPDAARLLRDLETNEALKHQPVAGSELDPALVLLRTWQSERLMRTYADWLEDKRTRPACLFFLTYIYAPRDFSQRDHDLERIHATVSHIAPPQVTELLAHVVELNHLTNTLDNQLIHMLMDQLGVTDTITPELYAEAYRRCDNYADRVHQIDLLTQVTAQVGRWAHMAIVGFALKIVKGPVHRAGWVELYEFLERGYDAFKRIDDVQKFSDMISQREKRILDQIYSEQADPFVI
jgi:hypothetical protein